MRGAATKWAMRVAAVMAAVLAAAAGTGDKKEPETTAERRAAIEHAFVESDKTDDLGEVEDATRKQIEAFFASLGEAFRLSDLDGIARHFSADEMLRNIEERGLVKLDDAGAGREVFRRSFRIGLRQGMGQWGQFMMWHKQDIRRVTRLAGDRFLVYGRFWNEEFEVYSKSRWWLMVSPEDGLRAYDWEDFDQNIRVSTLLGVMLGDDVNDAEWFEPLRELMQDYQLAVAASDPLSAMLTIQPQTEVVLRHAATMPVEVESFVRTLRVSALMLDEKYEEALEETGRLEELESDHPINFFYRGVAYLGLQQFGESIAQLEKYATTMGWDADVHELVSDAHRGNGDSEKALHHARLGLDDNSDAWGCLGSLVLALPADRKGEVAKRLARTADPSGAIEAILELVIDEGDVPAAHALLDLLKKADHDAGILSYYRMLVEEMAGETATN